MAHSFFWVVSRGHGSRCFYTCTSISRTCSHTYSIPHADACSGHYFGETAWLQLGQPKLSRSSAPCHLKQQPVLEAARAEGHASEIGRKDRLVLLRGPSPKPVQQRRLQEQEPWPQGPGDGATGSAPSGGPASPRSAASAQASPSWPGAVLGEQAGCNLHTLSLGAVPRTPNNCSCWSGQLRLCTQRLRLAF